MKARFCVVVTWIMLVSVVAGLAAPVPPSAREGAVYVEPSLLSAHSSLLSVIVTAGSSMDAARAMGAWVGR